MTAKEAASASSLVERIKEAPTTRRDPAVAGALAASGALARLELRPRSRFADAWLAQIVPFLPPTERSLEGWEVALRGEEGVDLRSGEPAIHVSEWEEPRFSEQTVEESLHNPSVYASLAAQLHAGLVAWPPSARWGAGRPAE